MIATIYARKSTEQYVAAMAGNEPFRRELSEGWPH